MKDILSEIIAHKKNEVAVRKAEIPFAMLEKQLTGRTIQIGRASCRERV